MQMMGLKGVFSSFVIGLIWPHKVICSRVVFLFVSSFFDRMRGCSVERFFFGFATQSHGLRSGRYKSWRCCDSIQQSFYPPLLNVFHHSRFKLRNSSCLQFIPLPSVTGGCWQQFRDGRPGGHGQYTAQFNDELPYFKFPKIDISNY